MIDRDRLIKALKHCEEYRCSDCPYFDENEECGANRDAITLLEEQDAVEPEIYFVGPDKYTFYRCPVCKTAWYYKCNYCLNCGRPVKWE